MHPPRIVASVLGADYMHLAAEVADLEAAGVDGIQWDVMDGSFVPPITFGADIVAAARPLTTVPFEAHLMVEHPETAVLDFVEAGCETVIFHAEVAHDLVALLTQIRTAGAAAGVALNPGTPLSVVEGSWEGIDLLVLMTVHPGYAGQAYLPGVEGKIAEARHIIDSRGLATRIEVDGGIKPHTIGAARAAGAEDFIAGSAILAHPQGKAEAVRELRAALR
jgi:ribulose-phosphate 3-epimerase